MNIKCIITMIIVGYLFSCSDSYHKGKPIVVSKHKSFFPGTCQFAYEGFGRREVFEDDCEKYHIGDTIK